MTTTDDHDQDGTGSSHCDHPACEDEIHKTYRDDNDNGLDLCEAHYYWLVSGKKPNSLKTPTTSVSLKSSSAGLGLPNDGARAQRSPELPTPPRGDRDV